MKRFGNGDEGCVGDERLRENPGPTKRDVGTSSLVGVYTGITVHMKSLLLSRFFFFLSNFQWSNRLRDNERRGVVNEDERVVPYSFNSLYHPSKILLSSLLPCSRVHLFYGNRLLTKEHENLFPVFLSTSLYIYNWTQFSSIPRLWFDSPSCFRHWSFYPIKRRGFYYILIHKLCFKE